MANDNPHTTLPDLTATDKMKILALINAGPKDWPEDFSHENGNYMCRCIYCKGDFTGHKRRVVCHECSDERAALNEGRRCIWTGETP